MFSSHNKLLNHTFTFFFRSFSTHTTIWRCEEFLPQRIIKKTNLLNEKKSQRAAIIINSVLPDNFQQFWSSATKRFCADGGSNRLYNFFKDEESRKKNLPHSIIGDLDSTETTVLNYYKSQGVTIKRDNNQDNTDLEKCLDLMDDQEIVVLGSLGGNFTQSLGNLNVLYLYPKKKIFFLSEENLLFLLRPGKHIIHSIKESKVGLIPLGNSVEKITTNGLQWNLDSQTLKFGGLVSSSNVMKEEAVTVETSHPVLWTVDFRE